MKISRSGRLSPRRAKSERSTERDIERELLRGAALVSSSKHVVLRHSACVGHQHLLRGTILFDINVENKQDNAIASCFH